MKHLIIFLILFISITSCKKEEELTTKTLKTEITSTYDYTITEYNIPNGDTITINHQTKSFTIINDYSIGFNYYIKCYNGQMSTSNRTTIKLYVNDELVKTKVIANVSGTIGVLNYQVQ